MDIPSIQKLCLYLISSAFQRCRLSDNLCRLSVVLNCSSATDPSLLQISNTGIGSSLEEFQGLRCTMDAVGAEKWDGELSVRTTSISDNEIYHYHLNPRETISSRRLTRLSSKPKNGKKFSGTEVYLSVFESVAVFLYEITDFFQKMLILQVPNVAIDLVAEQRGLEQLYENVFVANEGSSLFTSSSVERLKFGLGEYVLNHKNSLNSKCDSCFPNRENIKVGSGIASFAAGHKNAGVMMEAVVMISEPIQSTNSCFKSCSGRTEVLYFKNYSLSSIPQSLLNAFTSINWKSYGLSLASATDQGGCMLLEWGDFSPSMQIDMVLHCYNDQRVMQLARHKIQPDRSLIKRSVKLALDQLKEKHEGILLSAHALKICNYAPDLARTLAGLILSSNEPDFRGECLSLLGFRSHETEGQTVEDCIKEKIVSVIRINDRKLQKSREATPFLFEDDCTQNLYFQDETNEGEDVFSPSD